MRESRRPDYRQHLIVETPEHVLLDYELAGIGSRTLAALIDWSIVVVLMLIVSFAGRFLDGLGGWGIALYFILQYLVMAAYFTFFEGVRRGQTPGKRVAGIRVVRDTGHAITIAEAASRNLMNLPDMMMVGVFLIMLHPRAKRLGDLVAGTVVVRDRPAEGRAPLPLQATDDETVAAAGSPELQDDDFRILREFHQRAAELPAEARLRLGRILATRLAAHLRATGGDEASQLAELYQEETARRRSRFGARSTGGSPAERLVARKGDRWDAFQTIADRVSRDGLDALAAAELPDFAARYREVAADLARAHTYRADARTVLRLERLVAAGHNALYREDRRTWRTNWEFVTRQCPAEILAAWRTVLLAAVVFTVPGIAGYAALREQPGLAESLISDGMMDRAEAGAQRQAQGEGYFTAASEDRPVIAARIMINNVRVCFLTFAGGFFLGVGALFLLAFNGLQLGVTTGYFANLGLAGYLWTFVAGHGVLELFAIWVAGAAGLRLGLALVNPGEISRSDALTIAGRRAMRQMAAVVVLLIVAGTIEGLVSAGGYSLETRLAVTGASALFLVAYLANGRRAGSRE